MSRPSAIPKPRPTNTPAGEYLALTGDALTLLRLAKAAISEARRRAPSTERDALDKSLANCRDGMTTLTRARHDAQRRYAPDGRLKPTQPRSSRA